LLEPELIAEFAREYQLEFNKRQREAVRRNSEAVSAELERKRLDLKREFANVGGKDTVIQIRPDLSHVYKRRVAELRETLNGDPETGG